MRSRPRCRPRHAGRCEWPQGGGSLRPTLPGHPLARSGVAPCRTQAPTVSECAEELHTRSATIPVASAERRESPRKIALVDEAKLSATVDGCRSLIRDRFDDDDHHGAAAMLLSRGYRHGYRPRHDQPLGRGLPRDRTLLRSISAGQTHRRVGVSASRARRQDGRPQPLRGLSGIFAAHGPNVLVAVADAGDSTVVVWKRLKELLPNYWMTAFPDKIDPAWTD